MQNASQSPSWIAAPLPGIDPVQGWSIHPHGDHTGAWGPREYIAVNGSEYRFLGVSRWAFNPTQARWRWLVENGFPAMLDRPGGASSPISDDDIDAAIAAESVAA